MFAKYKFTQFVDVFSYTFIASTMIELIIFSCFIYWNLIVQ